MALKRYTVDYVLDNGQPFKINIVYEESTAQARLTAGGMTQITGRCAGAIARKYLKPRFVKHTTLGQIYFRTHADWLSYIEANKANIDFVKGESYSCTIVVLLV